MKRRPYKVMMEHYFVRCELKKGRRALRMMKKIHLRLWKRSRLLRTL